MLKKILHFVKYNNAVSIIFALIFSGVGVSLAASPTVRNSIYSSSETISSVDNHLILSTDLNNFNFNLTINSVREDEKIYYVAYSYQTLAIENSIWLKVSRDKTLTVSKESLGKKDLGLYVAGELGDNINYELSYLRKVQDLQKGLGLSSKIVTVAYSGLIGKLIDPKEKVIEGYTPIILETESDTTSTLPIEDPVRTERDVPPIIEPFHPTTSSSD